MMPTINPEIVVEQSRAILEELQLLGIEQIPKSDEPSLPVCPISESTDGFSDGKTRCRRETIDEISADLKACTSCQLSHSRKSIVFGEGDPNADLFLIGEFPDRAEDQLGLTFPGDASQLLDRILFAMGLNRESVYVANAVKCLPPAGQPPSQVDISVCSNLLKRQINAINPKIVIIFGETASLALLNNNSPISSIRGHWQEYKGISVMPTFHPSYLLKNPAAKRDVWEDMKRVIDRLHNDD